MDFTHILSFLVFHGISGACRVLQVPINYFGLHKLLLLNCFLLWLNAKETHAGNVANWYQPFSFSKWEEYSSCKWSYVFEKEGRGQYSAHLRVSFSAKRRWKIYITPFCFTNKFSSLIQLSSKIKYMDRISYNHWNKKAK